MRRSPFVALLCAALVASCSSSSESTGSSPSTTTGAAPTHDADDRGGVPPGYPLDVDVVAPLVITTIGPDPIPVTGTDGKVHVAYEVSVLNSGPKPATITKVETLSDGPAGAAVATIGQHEIVERTILIPNLLPAPVTEIPAGRTTVLVLDDAYDSWMAGVRHLTADALEQPVGSAEGPYAEMPMLALVLHINREVIHHGAEIALLRDLYAHTTTEEN